MARKAISGAKGSASTAYNGNSAGSRLDARLRHDRQPDDLLVYVTDDIGSVRMQTDSTGTP